jgi:hypothetical protein
MPIHLADGAYLPFLEVQPGGSEMGKLFAIVLMVIAIWVGITVFTEGSDRAFGGLFAGSTGSSTLEATEARSTRERARDALQSAYEESEDRVDRALGETR